MYIIFDKFSASNIRIYNVIYWLIPATFITVFFPRIGDAALLAVFVSNIDASPGRGLGWGVDTGKFLLEQPGQDGRERGLFGRDRYEGFRARASGWVHGRVP